MIDDIACARFHRVLRRLPAGHLLRLSEVAAPARAAGLTLQQASVLLDADPNWQRLFLDEYGFVVAARCAHDECTAVDSCQVAWRRLIGRRGARKGDSALRRQFPSPGRRRSPRGDVFT